MVLHLLKAEVLTCNPRITETRVFFVRTSFRRLCEPESAFMLNAETGNEDTSKPPPKAHKEIQTGTESGFNKFSRK